MVKPIFIVILPERQKKDAASIIDMIEKSIQEYCCIVCVDKNAKNIDFKCFFEKDFDEIKFEELKNIVENRYVMTETIVESDIIETLLDFNDIEIKQLYNSWDKGDCSLVGLAEIYLYQCIKKHKQENGAYYNTDYDSITLNITR